MSITATSFQLNLPPLEVTPLNRREGESFPILRLARQARERCGLKQAAMAAYMGISEPLLSAQFSELEIDKHLSLRRLGRVTVHEFWREFAFGILSALGLTVVVVSGAEREALADLQVAISRYVRASQGR